MVDEEKPGFCFSGDAITFDKIHLKLGVWTLQLVGHGCFFASLFYSLISPLASEMFLIGRLSISGRVFFLAGSVLVAAAYLIALHRVSVHLRLMRVASVLSALSIISGMLFSALLQDGGVASCVLLGLGLGALAVQWHYYCSVLDARIADVSYKAVGESTIIAGALLLCMVCMTALYGVALSFILSFTSLAICCLLLYKTYFAYCDVPCFAKDGVGRQAVKSTKPTLSSKALFYNFAYSLLLAWAFSFSPQQYLRGFEPQILAIVVILAGVVLCAIWVQDGVRHFFENTIRFYLPVTAVSILVYALFYPNDVCVAAVVVSGLMALLYAQSRIGYAIKVGCKSEGGYNNSVLGTFFMCLCGLLIGSFSFDFFFLNSIEKGPILGALFVGAIAVVVIAVGVGRGGYNLQAEQIRESEDAQVIDASNRRFYDAACERFAKQYDLTSRQVEVLRYLGKGRNAQYIQTKLGVSDHTVKSHIYSIYKKAEVHSQHDLMDMLDQLYYEEKNGCKSG